MARKPNVNAEGQVELEKTGEQIEGMEAKAKSINLDQTILATRKETEPQTKIAQSDSQKMPEIYLKPKRTYPPGVHPKTGAVEQFNEKFRAEYNFQKEYVEFIAENNEVIGESINLWIKKFPGTNLEEWVIPVNKPVWAPRMVKERIEECGYTVFRATQTLKSEEGINYNGYLEIQERKNRLNAREAPRQKKLYMGNYKLA